MRWQTEDQVNMYNSSLRHHPPPPPFSVFNNDKEGEVSQVYDKIRKWACGWMSKEMMARESSEEEREWMCEQTLNQYMYCMYHSMYSYK